MPIQVKDYKWQETETLVNIKVPLKGVVPAKVDIFSTDDYLKISYPPYLFEAFLSAAIDDDKSKAEIGSGIVNFVLRKKEPRTWGQLQHRSYEDKEFMKQRREKAIEYRHEKAKREREEKAAEKDRRQKYAVREQMRLDAEERKSLEDAKEAERRKAMEELEKWKEQEVARKEAEQKKINEARKRDEAIRKSKNAADIFAENHKKVEKVVPPPRSTGTIQCTFTPRVFPTPTRESKAPEEEAWLEKVAAMNKMKTDAKDAVDMEEMNPIWLKDKGSNFYKQGNYIAAINAFTTAIVLDGSIPLLYSNRAACHLQMKQYQECIQDCTSALERLTPLVPANAQSRCKALVRRGTAHFELQDYVSALQDYEAALKIDPKNEQLRHDAQKIRNIIQGTETDKQ